MGGNSIFLRYGHYSKMEERMVSSLPNNYRQFIDSQPLSEVSGNHSSELIHSINIPASLLWVGCFWWILVRQLQGFKSNR